jgi:hypothetical protein
MNNNTITDQFSRILLSLDGFPISGQTHFDLIKQYISQYSRLLFYSESDTFNVDLPISRLLSWKFTSASYLDHASDTI